MKPLRSLASTALFCECRWQFIEPRHDHIEYKTLVPSLKKISREKEGFFTLCGCLLLREETASEKVAALQCLSIKRKAVYHHVRDHIGSKYTAEVQLDLQSAKLYLSAPPKWKVCENKSHALEKSASEYPSENKVEELISCFHWLMWQEKFNSILLLLAWKTCL